ncbi:hypothetical protein [Fretibacter rubidus]|uniref:hypothetical protein n=1 Tax=Fretibacter rubidus TaxID=570162 RepID=UPI00352B6F29
MKNIPTLTALSIATVALTGCATLQDREYVDSMDCKALAEMQRNDVTAPAAIIDEWDNDRVYQRDRNILAQSRPEIRDSYLRGEYNKRCK